MMAAPKKLRIKYPDPAPQPLEFGKHQSAPRDQGDSNSVNANAQLGTKKAKLHLASSLGGDKFLAAGGSRDTFSEHGAKRRRSEEKMDSLHPKRLNMDRTLMFHCSAVLKRLMDHPSICLFSKPVDPVELGIPDYFTVITNPMDLGTVKAKLEKNCYHNIEEFAADVRLTFNNAIEYNPPDNIVYKIAKQLSHQFEVRWKPVERKFEVEKPKDGEVKAPSMQMKRNSELRQKSPRTPPLHGNTLPKRSNISGVKRKNVECDGMTAKVEFCKPVQSCANKSLEKKSSKGDDNGGESARHPTRRSMGNGACKCSKCGSIRCQCSRTSDSVHASSSDITSERTFSGGLHACTTDASQPEGLAKSTLTSKMSKSDPDSDGAVSAFDDGFTCLSSELKLFSTDSAAVYEGLTTSIFDVQMSPSKARRAAMLKTRFADTILKAQTKTLLDQGEKVDLAKIRQEKEQLERRQREEKAKIEARFRAAEAAAQLKTETESKKRREREREAARIALQKVVKTVELEQNLDILKELERLSGCSLSTYRLYQRDGSYQTVFGAFEGSRYGSPLQRLGLFIKDDNLDLEDEVDATLSDNREEGEIL